MISDSRVQIIKYLKGNTFDECFIRDFERQWECWREKASLLLDRYERLYQSSVGFQNYVDSYMSNKDVSLSDVLSMKTTRMIAQFYEKEMGINTETDLPSKKIFTIWKEKG